MNTPMCNNYLAHFTTLSAFREMLTGTEDTSKMLLRGTVFNKMNDGNESITLSKSFFNDSGIKKKLELEFDNWLEQAGLPYIISFSEANLGNGYKNIGQNIPMWLNYGQHGKGIVLVFDFQQTTIEGWELIKCEYVKSSDIKAIVKKLNQNKTNISTDDLNRLFVRVKNKEWEYEKEWRLFKNCPFPQAETYVRNDGAIVECAFAEIPIKCLSRIILGNQLDEKTTMQSIDTLLSKKELANKPKISRSKLNIQL